MKIEINLKGIKIETVEQKKYFELSFIDYILNRFPSKDNAIIDIKFIEETRMPKKLRKEIKMKKEEKKVVQEPTASGRPAVIETTHKELPEKTGQNEGKGSHVVTNEPKETKTVSSPKDAPKKK